MLGRGVETRQEVSYHSGARLSRPIPGRAPLSNSLKGDAWSPVLQMDDAALLETVQIVVTNAYGAPLSGAVVTIGGKSVNTGADGTASFSLRRGTYTAQVACSGYSTQSLSRSVTGSVRERVQMN